MRKIIPLITITLLANVSCFAQSDTIYLNNERIGCSIKEITETVVKYVYPMEELVNTVNTNKIQKIVYKSGRVQTFAEQITVKTVNGSEDFENVTVSSSPAEVFGLLVIGNLTVKARGVTRLSSVENVKERAFKRLKIAASMMGANVVLITQDTTVPAWQVQHTSTTLSGVAYSNKLPDYEEFLRLIGAKNIFQTYEKIAVAGIDADLERSNYSKNIKISKVYNENGMIMMNGAIAGSNGDTFRVINYTNNGFTIVSRDGDTIYNFKVKI